MNAVLNINVRVAARQAQAALNQVQQQVNGLGRTGMGAAGGMGTFMTALNPSRLEKFGKNLQWTGRQLEYSFTLPIIAAGAAATKFALDQDRAITRVRKVYGELGDDTHDLQGELKALETSFRLLSDQYGVHQEEVSGIAADWAQAGAAGRGLAESVKTTMQAVVLGELDAAKATEGLIGVQASFALSSQHLRDVLYDLNVIENQTGITMGGLIDVLSRAGGTARTAGVQIEELSALAAALVPATGSAAQAGNALRTIISRVMSPTAEASELMAQFGIDVTDASWQSLDAMGRIMKLASSFKELSDSQKTIVSTAIASRWQLNRFNVLAEDLTSTTGFFARAMKVVNGEVDAEAQSLSELNQVLGSNSRYFQILTNRARNLMIEGIQPLLPPIIGLLERLVGLMMAFNQLDPEMKQLITTGLILLAVIGPLSRIIGAFSLLFGVGANAIGIMSRALIGQFVTWTAWNTVVDAAGNTAVVASKRWAFAGGVFSKMIMMLVDLSRFGYDILVARPADFIIGVTRQVGVAVAGMWSMVVSASQTAALALMYGWGTIVATAQTAATAVGVAWVTTWAAVVSAFRTAATAIGLGFMFLQSNFMVIARTIPLLAVASWQGMTMKMLALQTRLYTFVVSSWAAMSQAITLITVGLQSYATLAIWKIQSAWAAFTSLMPTLWYKANAAVYMGMVRLQAFMTTAWVTMQATFVRVSMTMMTAFQAFITAFPVYVRTLPLFWAAAMQAMSTAWLRFQTFVMLGSQKMVASMVTAVKGGIVSMLSSMAAAATATTAVFGLPLWAVVAIVIAVIAAIAAIIENFYDDGIRGFVEDIANGLRALPQIFASTFQAVIRVLARAIEVIRDQLSYLNPFARHSPSLVENVSAGVSAILMQYARLRHIPGIMSAATRALQEFNQATIGAKNRMQTAQQAETRAEIVAVAPDAGPAVDNLFTALNLLRPALVAIGDEMAAQQLVVDQWKFSLDQANLALDEQKMKLDALRRTAEEARAQLDAAREELDWLRDVKPTGWYAMEDAIFANEMAQKRLRLEMLRLEEAGESIEDIRSKLAKLQGDIEMLRGEHTELRLAGAGSDVLGPIEDQIRLMEDAQSLLMSTGSPITEMQSQLEDLQRQGEIMSLEKAIEFDPVLRQIEQVGQAMTEMPVEELMKKLADQQAIVDSLTLAWKSAELAVEEQESVVRMFEAERDAVEALYKAEDARLDSLKEAYEAVEQQIRDMEAALNDFSAAARKAASDEQSNALKMFDAAAGFDFDDVGGTGGIGREGDLFDIEAFNAQLQKDMEKMSKDLGGLDIFKPIKDMFKGAWEWIKRNSKNIIIGAFIVIGFLIFEAVAFIPAVIVEIIALGLYLLFGPKVFKAIWDSFKNIMGSVWQVIQALWEPIGDVFTVIFSGIGVALVWVWENVLVPIWNGLVALITDVVLPVLQVLGEVFATIFGAIADVVVWAWQKIIYPLLKALWNFINDYVVPVLQMLAAIAEIVFVMIARIIGWAWDNVIRPIFEAVWWVITNVLVPIFQLFGAVVAIIFTAIARLITDVLGPVFVWLWQNIISPVLGWIGDGVGVLWNVVMKPIFDGIVWFIQNVLAPVFGWLWHNVIEPAMQGIGDIVSSIWGGITTAIKNSVNFFIRAFNTIARGIKRVAEFLNIKVTIDEMPEIGGGGSASGANNGGRGTAQMFHSGGVVDGAFGGPGLRSDEMRAILQRGEGILPADAMRKLGRDTFEKLRRGEMDNVYDESGGILETITNAAKAVAQGAIKAVASPLFAAADRAIDLIPFDLAKAGARRIKNDVWDWITNLDKVAGTDGGSGKVSGAGYPAIISWLKNNSSVPFRVTSTLRPFDPGRHGRGLAADFAGPTPSQDSPQLLAIYKAFLPIAKTLNELIYSGPGGGGWKAGSRHNYSAAVQADHHDHVHAALYNGGLVRGSMGGSLIRLGERFRDEAVVPLPNGIGDMGKREYHFHGDLSFPNVTSGDDAKTFLRNLESLVE